MSFETVFDKTCEPVKYSTCGPDSTSTELLSNPCDCMAYYQCSQSYTMNVGTCPGGTLFNHNISICDFEDKVRHTGICDPGSPWDSCNVAESRLLQLEAMCTNTTVPTTPGATVTTPPPTAAGDDGINAGIVVGAVIAGAFVALIIVVAIIIFRRRNLQKQKKAGFKRESTVVQNPEYFEGGRTDDPYAIIDDRLNDPTYRQDSYMEPRSQRGDGVNGGLHGNTLADTMSPPTEDTVYDNTARSPTATPGYDTYSKDNQAPDPPYRSLNQETRDTKGASNLYVDDPSYRKLEPGASVDESPTYMTRDSGTSNDDDPSYRTLEPRTSVDESPTFMTRDSGSSNDDDPSYRTLEPGTSSFQDGDTTDIGNSKAPDTPFRPVGTEKPQYM